MEAEVEKLTQACLLYTSMGSLNEIVTMYLDYAERQAHRGNIMYMPVSYTHLDVYKRQRCAQAKVIFENGIKNSRTECTACTAILKSSPHF